jgi:hypothetical protein
LTTTKIFKNGIENEDFKNKYQGMACYIVGKGPSLDKINIDLFLPSLPILCLNEAIIIVRNLRLPNPIFSFQVDYQPVNYNLDTDIVIAHINAAESHKEHPNLHIIETQKWPLTLSPIKAIHFAHYCGCNRLLLLGMDALRGINGYASNVKPFIHTKEYLKSTCSASRILRVIKSLNLTYEFII